MKDLKVGNSLFRFLSLEEMEEYVNEHIISKVKSDKIQDWRNYLIHVNYIDCSRKMFANTNYFKLDGKEFAGYYTINN